MHRLPHILLTICCVLLTTAALMRDGKWCPHCQREAVDECKDNGCLVPLPGGDHVDIQAFQHEPAVEFGGWGGE